MEILPVCTLIAKLGVLVVGVLDPRKVLALELDEPEAGRELLQGIPRDDERHWAGDVDEQLLRAGGLDGGAQLVEEDGTGRASACQARSES